MQIICRSLRRVSPEALSKFFETDPLGIGVAGYALRTLTYCDGRLVGRLVSSVLLGVLRVNVLYDNGGRC